MDARLFNFSCTNINPTQREQVKQVLTDEKEFFDAVVGSAPVVFYVLVEEGDYRRWNNHLNHLTGLSDREL